MPILYLNCCLNVKMCLSNYVFITAVGLTEFSFHSCFSEFLQWAFRSDNKAVSGDIGVEFCMLPFLGGVACFISSFSRPLFLFSFHMVFNVFF